MIGLGPLPRRRCSIIISRKEGLFEVVSHRVCTCDFDAEDLVFNGQGSRFSYVVFPLVGWTLLFVSYVLN